MNRGILHMNRNYANALLIHIDLLHSKAGNIKIDPMIRGAIQTLERGIEQIVTRGSELPRVMNCNAAYWNPDMLDKTEPINPDANTGSAAHACLGKYVSTGYDLLPDDIDSIAIEHDAKSKDVRIQYYIGKKAWDLYFQQFLTNPQVEKKLVYESTDLYFSGSPDIYSIEESAGIYVANILDWKMKITYGKIKQLMGYAFLVYLEALEQGIELDHVNLMLYSLLDQEYRTVQIPGENLKFYYQEIINSIRGDIKYCPSVFVCDFCPYMMDCKGYKKMMASEVNLYIAVLGDAKSQGTSIKEIASNGEWGKVRKLRTRLNGISRTSTDKEKELIRELGDLKDGEDTWGLMETEKLTLDLVDEETRNKCIKILGDSLFNAIGEITLKSVIDTQKERTRQMHKPGNPPRGALGAVPAHVTTELEDHTIANISEKVYKK